MSKAEFRWLEFLETLNTLNTLTTKGLDKSFHVVLPNSAAPAMSGWLYESEFGSRHSMDVFDVPHQVPEHGPGTTCTCTRVTS